MDKLWSVKEWVIGYIFYPFKRKECNGENESAIREQQSRVGAVGTQSRVLTDRQVRAKPSSQMSQYDRITAQLKQVKDQLNKRLAQVGLELKQTQDAAREHLRNDNKIRAKLALERKQLIGQYEMNLLNQEYAVLKTLREIQENHDTLKVTETLKQANQLMININRAIDINAIQDAADNLEQLEENNQAFAKLMGELGGCQGVDEHELNKQMNDLEAEVGGLFSNNRKQQSNENASEENKLSIKIQLLQPQEIEKIQRTASVICNLEEQLYMLA